MTRIQPGYELLQSGDGQLRTAADGTIFGPHIGDLQRHFEAGHVSVIRGMSMDTLTHEVGRRRFLTGKPRRGCRPAAPAARCGWRPTWASASPSPTSPCRWSRTTRISPASPRRCASTRCPICCGRCDPRSLCCPARRRAGGRPPARRRRLPAGPRVGVSGGWPSSHA
ncbi:MAG: hypothetical protein R3F43_23740 [bacterium]